MRGLSTLTLAGMELRRFLRGRLTAAALVVLAVIPLLYGALYLYAFWDPYGRLNHIPAALVVDDRPAKATDGSTVQAGKDLADELFDRQIFDWDRVGEREAERGIADGRYQLMLHIPADFSAHLVTSPDAGSAPESAQLRAVSDDATNYLSGVFARTAFDEVRSAAAASASAKYYDQMLIGFSDLKKETGKAADGAGKLENGTGRAHAGATKVANGTDTAHSGAGRLAAGLGAAGSGADQLVTGLTTLSAGTRQIASATQQAAGAGRQLADRVDRAADQYGPFLAEHARQIEESAALVADGADKLADNLGAIVSAADRAVAGAEKLQTYVDGSDAGPETTALAAQLVTDTRKVRATIGAADLSRLRTDLRETARIARAVADRAPRVSSDLTTARADIDRFAAGLDRIATGAQRLRTGSAQLQDGATDLRGGIYRLATGARQLDGGLARLAGGGHQLADGLGDLQGGAERLASGLSDGADKIPGYGDDPQARADMLANPVSLDRQVRNPAGTYGVGFAPYFLALALWVGAMITFMVLKPLNRRYLMSGAPAPRVALATLLPAGAIGLVQASVLFAVVTLGLGLSPVHPLATWGLLALTAVVFAAIMQLLGAALGAVGRILSLALLMLQLTSSGGTYPVQTTPGFFQALHPLLPMTYVVEAMRHTIDGGASATVWHGGLLLVAFGLGALLLTILVAYRKRSLTPAELHPELVL